MIAMLRGVIAQKDDGTAIVDVNGVGYLVQLPASVVAELGEGEESLLHISTAVREDAITLFGFLSPEDRATFEMLREVNGVGPRTASSNRSKKGHFTGPKQPTHPWSPCTSQGPGNALALGSG